MKFIYIPKNTSIIQTDNQPYVLEKEMKAVLLEGEESFEDVCLIPSCVHRKDTF